MIHNLKILKPFADAVVEGRKTAELRYNDRGFNCGDLVKFQCVEEDIKPTYHEINNKIYEITYVFNYIGLQPNYVIFCIKECEVVHD